MTPRTLSQKSEHTLANPGRTDQPIEQRSVPVATLSEEEDVVATRNAVKPFKPGHGPKRPINPAVKSLIDNVIVPALVEEWIRTSAGRLAG